MKCGICSRDNLSEKEVMIHTKVFHNKVSKEQPQKVASGVCPECKSTLWFVEGCMHCPSCGFSKC